MNKNIKFIEIPSVCPVCGGTTEIKQENNSTVLVCTNDNCKGKLLGKLTHFVSKNAMNIEGLSEATLEKFIELGWLTKFIDIYYLDVNKKEMMQLEGFGEKSVKKLLNSIEKSKNTTLSRFIYALSIPTIGSTASKTIAKHFNNDFDKFIKACDDVFDWTTLDDFGETMSAYMDDYLDAHTEEIKELAKEFEFESPQSDSNNTNLSGKVFVITGSLEHFVNRDEAKEKIEQAGGKVNGSVSAKTDYLVCNEISNSSKCQKAQSLGVKIISEEELIRMLNS